MGRSGSIRKTGIEEGGSASPRDGYTVDPGPYEAIVVKHVEGSRMGQLRVVIPDWEGQEGTDGDGELSVSYASPFYGGTYGTDTQLTPTGPNTNGQSYGMWMVPPDIGCKVLVMFVNGDKDRGYWFACIYDSTSHHMVPALGRNVGGKQNVTVPDDELATKLTSDTNAPVVEASTADPNAFDEDAVTGTPRYPHEFQTYVLINQGLDRDKVRGAVSSSSLRETPSNVYGISTPGRKITKDDQVKENPQKIVARTGGHSFVMDDGAAKGSSEPEGTDQLIRLRTSGGHQLLMNDTEGIYYLGSKTGLQWLEFSKDGSINIYGYAGFNVRSTGPMNFHSDSAIKFHAGGTIDINADYGININSIGSVGIQSMVSTSVKSMGLLSLSAVGAASLAGGASCSVGSYLNTSILGALVLLNAGGRPPLAVPPMPVIPNRLPDTEFNGTVWIPREGSLGSTCTVVPCHEPWLDGNGPGRPKPAGGGSLLKAGAKAAGALVLSIGISKAIGAFG
jgi:hypothetical protein